MGVMQRTQPRKTEQHFLGKQLSALLVVPIFALIAEDMTERSLLKNLKDVSVGDKTKVRLLSTNAAKGFIDFVNLVMRQWPIDASNGQCANNSIHV